jgi:hypothetical protein
MFPFPACEELVANEKYIVGGIYYQLGIALIDIDRSGWPLATTWRYDGVVTSSCNSHSCDVPFHFMRFTCMPENTLTSIRREPERLLIPSKAQAALSMLTWKEFVDAVADLAEDTEEGGRPL